MRQKTYLIHTFGCQMNEHDSEKIAWLLEQNGYFPVASEEEADIILFNTCAIRQTAEDKVYGKIGSLKPLKRKYPKKIIGISGCMMQTDTARDKIKYSHEHVNLIFGTHNIWKLPEFIKQLESGTKDRIIDIDTVYNRNDELVKANRRYDFKAFVNIMYGCNNFCTYCIVPYTRGREVSREPDAIVEEINSLVDKGCKEVTLLGQNVNSYGKTLETPMSFAELLTLINDIEGLERIRFMTSHPKDISDELIACYGKLNKLCPILHLPLQSGSTKVLKEMNRHYTKEEYLNIVKKLRETAPNISITTDLMVGFPGETEEDFQETLDVIKQVEYDSSFTFIYSPRPGTPAADREDQVSDEIKHKRFDRMLDVLYPIANRKNQKFIGTKQRVLVEGTSKTNHHILTGRTGHDRLVHFKGNDNLIGQFVEVEIIDATTFTLEGELKG